MKRSAIHRLRNRINCGIATLPEQHDAARRLRAEWETFLARAGFEFAEDALSRETVTLEEAGLEEEDSRAVFGFDPISVTSGVRCVCDEFYEEDSAEFITD